MGKTPEMEFLLKNLREQFGVQEVDFSKLDYWVGNTQRSDFEEYLQIKKAQEQLEISSKLNSADGLADGVDSLLTLLNKEKGNNEFLEHISLSLPKHDYWERYNEYDTIMNTDDLTEANLPADSEEQAEESAIDSEIEENNEDMGVDRKSDLFDEFEGNTEDKPESGLFDEFEENSSDVTSNSDLFEEFEDSTRDKPESGLFDEFEENSSDVIRDEQNEAGTYDDFLENADDIVEKEKPSDSGYDDFTHDLKP